MMSWVRSLVWVIQQLTWRGCIAREPRNENTGSGRSPGCSVEPGEIDGAAVDARRRAGLQAPDRQLQLAQPRGERERRRVAGAAAPGSCRGRRGSRPPRKVPAVSTTARRGESQADGGHGADDAVALDDQVVDRLLEEPQVGLVFEAAADGGAVQHAVGLGARGAHRRALARVEGAELDPRLVGGDRHGAAQRIDLPDQVALADAADRGVAGHLAERLDGVREQQRAGARARRGERRLGAGMPAAHHDHVELLGKVHGLASKKGQRFPQNQDANSTGKASSDPPLFHVERRLAVALLDPGGGARDGPGCGPRGSRPRSLPSPSGWRGCGRPGGVRTVPYAVEGMVGIRVDVDLHRRRRGPCALLDQRLAMAAPASSRRAAPDWISSGHPSPVVGLRTSTAHPG